MSSEVRPTGWIPTCVVAFITSIITGYTLIQEIRVRQRKKPFENKETKRLDNDKKWLSLSSMLCLIFGFLGNVFTVIYNLNGLCHGMGYAQAVCLWLQPICLTIYQFHQLYLIDKEYKVKQFPRWVFIFLDIVGIIAALNIFSFPVLFIQTRCGITEEGDYSYDLNFSLRQIISIWFAVLIITWLLIEALQLFLYAYKLRLFRNSKVGDQINAILGRIITLIVVNDIFAVLAGFTVSFLQANKFDQTEDNIVLSIGLCIYTTGYLSPSIVVSNSMRLMMTHNTEEYVKFLKLLLKIKCICCCIRGDLRDQSYWIKGDHKRENNQSNETQTGALVTTKTSSRQRSDTTPAVNDTGDESTRGFSHKGSRTHMKEISLIPGAPMCLPLRTNLTVD